jgi:beta-N-acetylhexosaminidase
MDGIAAHAEAVMLAHVIYPAVDAQPAGYSAVWVKRILRGELGFTGAIISDDISMAAAGAAGSIGARVRAHLQAGCDLVLACFPDVVAEAIAAMPTAAKRQQHVLPPALEALRGELGATWAELADNPQRDRFVAHITALNAAQGVA